VSVFDRDVNYSQVGVWSQVRRLLLTLALLFGLFPFTFGSFTIAMLMNIMDTMQMYDNKRHMLTHELTIHTVLIRHSIANAEIVLVPLRLLLTFGFSSSVHQSSYHPLF
jgi:hypothetical protein